MNSLGTLLLGLVDSATDNTEDDTTIPTLSLGWEFISMLGVIIAIPIPSRRKRT
ncbi:MAG: hypothetical protein ACW98F_07340 [Candidatus Hodarchaeales archaeon]